MTAIYLASRYSRHDEMRGVRDVLESMGPFKVTSRWIDLHADTGTEQTVSYPPDMLNTQPELCADNGIRDLDDIARADWMVSFTCGTGGKGGRHAEFGFALALHKRLFVVGPREHVFHTLPQVEQHATWRHFVVALAGGFRS